MLLKKELKKNLIVNYILMNNLLHLKLLSLRLILIAV